MLENPNIRAPIAISLGAIAGALSRHYCGQWLMTFGTIDFPLGTFAVNLSGSFLMGLVTMIGMNRLAMKPELFLLMATGFLGSYTTFSTYELDASLLFAQFHLKTAFLYWFGSPLLGLIGVSLGMGLGAIALPPQAEK